MKSFDFFKFTDKKSNSREFLQGFFCENGYKIATNAKILVMVKDTYDKNFENHIIAKDNTFINGVFPAYKSVIPLNNSKAVYTKVSTEKLYEVQKALTENKGVYSVHKKLLTAYEKNSNGGAVVLVQGHIFSIAMIERVLYFLSMYPDSEFYMPDRNYKASYLIAGTKDNIKAICVFMPMILDLSEYVLFNGVYFEKQNITLDMLNFIKKYYKNAFERDNLNCLTSKDKKDYACIEKYFSFMCEKVCVETTESISKKVTADSRKRHSKKCKKSLFSDILNFFKKKRK